MKELSDAERRGYYGGEPKPPLMMSMGHQTHELPEALRTPPTPAQTKTKYLRDGLKLARDKVMVNTVWRHYKGGIYRITGHLFNATTQTFDARYERIGGPDFDYSAEMNIEFGRDYHEWDETVDIGAADAAHNPNVVDVLEQPGLVYRYVKVQEVKRYETIAQIKERDAK
jgi:hypothetical protein